MTVKHRWIKACGRIVDRKYGKMYLLVGPFLNNHLLSRSIDIKILEISPKTKTSYHYHNNVESFFFVLSGKAIAKIDDVFLSLEKTDYIFVKAGIKHQLINNFNKTLLLIELWFHHMIKNTQFFMKTEVQ